MLKRVEPLREELNSLELQAETNINHGKKEVKDLIAQLVLTRRNTLSSAHLASQVQAIKTDLENITSRQRRIALGGNERDIQIANVDNRQRFAAVCCFHHLW